jgi:hypothetical protein
MTAEEKAACDLAESASTRWGKPVVEPKKGCCRDCRFYVRLDGSFYFLDYGVCSAEGSDLDGRVTNVESGCPKHARVDSESHIGTDPTTATG